MYHSRSSAGRSLKIATKYTDLSHVLIKMTSSSAHTCLPELLSIIFSLALPSDVRHVHSRKHSPINVSQVCSSWRNTALETSSLWAHLALYSHHTLHKDIWYLWLARSKNQTLRFTIIQDNRYDEVPALCDLVRIMVDNVDRWRDIHVNFWRPIAIFVPSFPPTLESLHCSRYTAIYPFPLMRMDVKSFQFDSDWHYTNHCHSATAVSLLPLPVRVQSVLPVFYRSGLEPLEETTDDNEPTENIGVIRVPWEIVRKQFEERSNLPSLNHLSIEGGWHMGDYPENIFNIPDLICRCIISPVTLSLVTVDINTSELCSVLQSCFRLTDLVLVMADFTNVDLSSLFKFLDVPHDASQIVCPVLQVLRLDEARDFNRRLFVDMVISRWRFAKSKGMGFSVSLRYTLARDFTDGQKKELEGFAAEGLDVELYDMWYDLKNYHPT